ncbi:fumarylacetoacetase [Acidothermaceae bacterium B102]|nr:fumarylacetoacetase [Acidothermaceae bacterium B102]
MTGWVEVAPQHGFGIDALPYGSFSTSADHRRVGVAIGDSVLDLTAVTRELMPDAAELFADGSLDRLLAAGPQTWAAVRAAVTAWLSGERWRPSVEPHLHPAQAVTMHLPFAVADYVDFYASEVHATTLGRLFRPDGDALTPNWKHLPIGYHGRAGTVVVSGAGVRRPSGQHLADGEVVFGPSERLDLEAEVGFVIGTSSTLGQSVSLAEAEQHVFGVCLVNDWSARDLQAWEYVPLGPFLGKSFATSMSPWVLPLAALDAARVVPPHRDVPLLPYLDDAGAPPYGLDLQLEVRVNGTVVSQPMFREMYWTSAQLVAHLTVNGASLRTGDLLASGTVSSAGPRGQGSLIELTNNGRNPLALADGTARGFLEDGDEVVISATAPGPHGVRISLGEVRGMVVPTA